MLLFLAPISGGGEPGGVVHCSVFLQSYRVRTTRLRARSHGRPRARCPTAKAFRTVRPSHVQTCETRSRKPRVFNIHVAIILQSFSCTKAVRLGRTNPFPTALDRFIARRAITYRDRQAVSRAIIRRPPKVIADTLRSAGGGTLTGRAERRVPAARVPPPAAARSTKRPFVRPRVIGTHTFTCEELTAGDMTARVYGNFLPGSRFELAPAASADPRDLARPGRFLIGPGPVSLYHRGDRYNRWGPYNSTNRWKPSRRFGADGPAGVLLHNVAGAV